MRERLAVWVNLALFSAGPAAAQAAEPAMADGLRADGKIWVVVGVILIVVAGLLAYLVHLDRRVRKAEDEAGRRDPA